MEHVPLSRLGGFGVAHRCVVLRRGDEPRQGGGLRQIQRRRVLAEVVLRRRADAVGSVSQIDGVHVHLQELVLGVDSLQADGEDGLLDLPCEGLLPAEEEISRQLLGDGASPLSGPLVGQVDPQGPKDRGGAKPRVLVELAVLGSQSGLQEPRGDLVQGDPGAVLLEQVRDHPAVPVQQGGGQAGLPPQDLLRRGQGLREILEKDRESHRGQGGSHEEEQEKKAHEDLQDSPGPAGLQGAVEGWFVVWVPSFPSERGIDLEEVDPLPLRADYSTANFLQGLALLREAC